MTTNSNPEEPSKAAAALLDRTLRDDHAQVFAALVSVTRDLDRAEEALQDACAEALESWGRGGLPERPAAWLVAVGRRRAIDRTRRESARSRREQVLAAERAAREEEQREPALDEGALPDERLRLVFTCCHPALSVEAQVALTLRAVSGLSTEAIARAFLVSTETMAQRLVRAKRKIREAGIPFAVPAADRLAERLRPVLSVVYLVFNEGYAASEGAAHVRRELCVEAIALAGLLAELLPEEGEVHGLLALLTLLDARREARVDANGLPLLLADQDRTRWDDVAIQRGVLRIAVALRCGPLGPYGLQAAIAAAHAEAKGPEHTPWDRIVALYDSLAAQAPTPVVQLNRIAARAMADGAQDALADLDALEREVPALRAYVWARTLRAELLVQRGDAEAARAELEAAEPLAGSEAQRGHLRRRLRALGD